MKYYSRTVIFLACFIFSLNLVSATYLSGDIFIYQNGEVRFDVESDVPIEISGLNFENGKITGLTGQLTSFQGGVWTFQLDLGEYDDIFLNINLPRGLDSITEIEGSNHLIDIQKRIITIADSGTLNFKTSYRLGEAKDNSWIFWTILILLIISASFIYRRIKWKKERFNHIMPLVGDKEEQIINMLMKKAMRQKELRKALNLPKASFSRYMVNLEKKKLIVREGEGKNKVVRLK
ncbi:MAG: hypothetical protein ABIH92_03900 [Nanoarchaeota archaeon]